MYAANDLQAAMVADLDGNITGEVRDHVRQGTMPPYTVVGELTEVPDDLHDRDGGVFTATLHIWSAAGGWKEANGIAAEIDARWHHGSLTISGYNVAGIEREMTATREGVDPVTGDRLRHLIVRYRVTVYAVP